MCSPVTGHLNEVIIQNVQICNSNVPVTIFREKTQKVVNRTEQLQKWDKYLGKFNVWNDTDDCEIWGWKGHFNKDSLFRGCYGVSTDRRLRTFWNRVVSPSSGLIKAWRLNRPPVNVAWCTRGPNSRLGLPRANTNKNTQKHRQEHKHTQTHIHTKTHKHAKYYFVMAELYSCSILGKTIPSSINTKNKMHLIDTHMFNSSQKRT